MLCNSDMILHKMYTQLGQGRYVNHSQTSDLWYTGTIMIVFVGINCRYLAKTVVC